MSVIRDKGVVLRSHRLGEADKIIVFLTQDHGKVRAVAKGIRRTASKYGARLEPMSHVTMIFWQGRSELDSINQVEVLDNFRSVREDLDRLSKGLSLLEVCDQLAQLHHPDPRLYEMLVGALGALGNAEYDPTLLAPSFFLKALALEGARPILDSCASCARSGSEVSLVAFDLVEGGALCQNCRRGRPLSPDALVLLKRILGGDLTRVLSGVPPQGSKEVALLALEAMESHLERRIRSIRAVVTI